MFFFLCPPLLTLSDFSDISQVIIASTSLFLAGYIFLYQLKKDKKVEFSTAKLNEQNIKLQWFKELIVEPNISVITNFYDHLHTIRGKIISDNMTAAEREDLNEFVKTELSVIRKSFTDVLLQIDKAFANEVLGNLDTLVDGITESIFNDELKLTHPAVYEKNIGSKISYSKNNIISLLYNYKGLSD